MVGLLAALVGRCLAASPIDLQIHTDRLINSTYMAGRMREDEVPGAYWVSLTVNNFNIHAHVN